MKRNFRVVIAVAAFALACAGCDREKSTAQTDSPAEVEAAEVGFSEAPPEKPAPVGAPPGELDPRVIYNVPLDGTEPQRGPDDALMTLVEFGDFQCPFCAKATPTMDQLVAHYGDDLRVVWLNLPLPGHRHARSAATAALEAQAQKGDEAFWKMHDKLFGNPGAIAREDLLRYGKELGLNVKQLEAALDEDRYGDVIDRQVALAKRLNVSGTPAWFLNGRFMSGFPFQTWVGAIDRRIGGARAAVAKGIPKSELYDRIVADGKLSP